MNSKPQKHPFASEAHYETRLSLSLTAVACCVAWSCLSTAQAQTTCVQPPTGIIAWWSFDETSGTIAADRVGNHPAAYANGPVPAEGEVRGSLRFDGSNYLAVQDSDLWA